MTTAKSSSPDPARWSDSLLLLLVSVGLVITFLIGSASIAYLNIRTLQRTSHQISRSRDIITALDQEISLVKDAETGQRGFVITGDEKYLEPYNAAIPRVDVRLNELAELVADNPLEQAHLPAIRREIAIKLHELEQNVAIRRAQGFEAARAGVMTDRGKAAMDAVRAEIAAMTEAERVRLSERFAQADGAFRAAVQSTLLSTAAGFLLTVFVALLLRRAALIRQRQLWLQNGSARLNELLIGDKQMNELAENALRFLCEYLEAKAGAIFVDESGVFRLFATYAIPAEARPPERFQLGEGLLGQAAKDARPFVLKEVPAGYLSIGSSLGRHRPQQLLIAPATVDGAVNAVLELGFFESPHEASVELLTRCAETIGVAVRSAYARERIAELLAETQRQTEELQTQSEELRVSNEELEEHTRALQRSQAQLERQQVEMEEVNTQLEEQTRTLESQRDDLTQAKSQLENQARAVEQASRYKSSFLANMSHELRTPLNSSLILAQILTENREGNLNEQQIEYARTIQSSGNDLLALINDVLDLAKIEAGRMDLKPQRIMVDQLLESLRGQFEPVAKSRQLALHLRTLPGAPESIETDPLRLEQVLRNLLSNALKFTEAGEVALEFGAAAPDQVSFVVRDTGIGIEHAQQRIIFEPFCQADGTANRKYGGTGLGLSISRDLARLLGGEIQLASEIGRGSVFTVFLPTKYGLAPSEPAPRPAPPAAASPRAASPLPGKPKTMPGAGRTILIVEDDPRFAEILANLGREKDFQGIVTASAQEALTLAQESPPSAILLDIGLPDDSGLLVLDRLKHDARTRHIPVHVISGSDYAEKAIEMGAIGCLLKPVPPERLAEAFQRLESQLSHRLRRVLVVEDDNVQRAALCQLLASREVEALGARDATECLARLRDTTFDCMVLDLSLPDSSGFSLLETISGDDAYSFPPVIIYTGRELSTDEEQRLRRYSKAIIIKGAKSPERLLDEVALFLHQVVAELPPEQQRMIEKARRREAALEGRRILLAEDDVRNIFALTSLMEPLGIDLHIARNGREALEALEKKTPIDLILMDIMMPEMDGITAIRAIRQRAEWMKTPIIALTAKAMPNDQQQCLDAGANDYLAKPLDVNKLLSLIRVWMPR